MIILEKEIDKYKYHNLKAINGTYSSYITELINTRQTTSKQNHRQSYRSFSINLFFNLTHFHPNRCSGRGKCSVLISFNTAIP